MNKLIRFFKDEEGATAVEYAIMVALIAIVIIAAVIFLGEKVCETFSNVGSHLDAAS
jgi:pilus assembly protein Flp/PilA